MKTGRLLLGTGFTLLGVLILAATGSTSAKELRVAYPVDIVSFDPASYRHRWTEIILRNSFDGLLTRTPSMELVPDLAEAWSQIDPVTYEFSLRAGIRFHDGTELNADHVVSSFQRILNPGAIDGVDSPRRALLGPLDTVMAEDSLTVRFVLNSPWPIFPAMLPFQQIVAPYSNEDRGFTETKRLPKKWMGTGAFTLSEHYPGDALIFDRNKLYFGGASELPPVGNACVDRMAINVIPNNESRVAGLLAGDFDLVVDIKPHSVATIRKHSQSEVHIVDGTRSFFLAMRNSSSPFNDSRVRKAVVHALNRKQLIDENLGGMATVIDGILGPGMFGRNNNLSIHTSDPDLARSLLQEAGYPEGLELMLDVTRELYPLAEAIGLQLAAAGIRTQVVVGASSEIRQRWRSNTSQDFHRLWLTSWGGAAMDPVGIFDATHHSKGRGNVAKYVNSELDRLLDLAGLEQDEERREQFYYQAEEIINRDVPYAYLWVPQEIYGISNRVTGFSAAPDGRLNLQDVCVAGSE